MFCPLFVLIYYWLYLATNHVSGQSQEEPTCLIEISSRNLSLLLLNGHHVISHQLVILLYTVSPDHIRDCPSCVAVESTITQLCGLIELSGGFQSHSLSMLKVAYQKDDKESVALLRRLEVGQIPTVDLFYKGRTLRCPEQAMLSTSLLVHWLIRGTNNEIGILHDVNSAIAKSIGWKKQLLTAVLGLSGSVAIVATLFYFWEDVIAIVQPVLAELISSRNAAIACICIILVSISGQMWNQIRGPPLIHFDPQKRSIGIIGRGHMSQLIVESYIVIALYALMSWILVYMDSIVHHKVMQRESISQIEASRSLTAVMGFVVLSNSMQALYRMKG